MSQLTAPALALADVHTDLRSGIRTDTDLRNTSLPPDSATRPTTEAPLNPKALARIARHLAGQVDLWRPLLHVDPDQRWYTRLMTGDG